MVIFHSYVSLPEGNLWRHGEDYPMASPGSAYVIIVFTFPCVGTRGLCGSCSVVTGPLDKAKP